MGSGLGSLARNLKERHTYRQVTAAHLLNIVQRLLLFLEDARKLLQVECLEERRLEKLGGVS